MKYEHADDLKEKALDVIRKLNLNHIRVEDVGFLRSWGSKSRAIARCHALGKVMQKAMGRKAYYTIEFISERFDRMKEEDKIKTIIHELMHIPKTFGGGFIHHDMVCERNVNFLFRDYVRKSPELGLKEEREKSFWSLS